MARQPLDEWKRQDAPLCKDSDTVKSRHLNLDIVDWALLREESVQRDGLRGRRFPSQQAQRGPDLEGVGDAVKLVLVCAIVLTVFVVTVGLRRLVQLAERFNGSFESVPCNARDLLQSLPIDCIRSGALRTVAAIAKPLPACLGGVAARPWLCIRVRVGRREAYDDGLEDAHIPARDEITHEGCSSVLVLCKDGEDGAPVGR